MTDPVPPVPDGQSQPPLPTWPNIPGFAQDAGEPPTQPAQAIPGQPVTGVPYPHQPPFPGQPVTGSPYVGPPPIPGQPVPGFPAQTWIPTPAPPERNGGKIVGIVIGIVAGVCAICVAVGALAWPSFKKGFDEGMNRAAHPTPSASSPTRDITAVPAVGLCYTSIEQLNFGRGYYTAADTDSVISCLEPHNFETVAAGTFPDPGITPPDSTAPSVIDAYNQCSAAVDAFLGQAWAGTYAWAIISVPSSFGWSKGAHWYRCDVMGSSGVYNLIEQSTAGSMKGAAKPIGCVSWTLNPDGSETAIAGANCDGPHNGEVIGAGPMPSGVDLTNRNAVETAVGNLCGPFITSYMGEAGGHLPSGLWLSYFRPKTTQADGMLDQNIICIISPQNKTQLLKGSLKNLGNNPIPYVS
jgi:hypothetical protein